jgi:hypothetical protein
MDQGFKHQAHVVVAWRIYSYILMQTTMFEDVPFIRQPCTSLDASLLIGSAGDARNFRPHHHHLLQPPRRLLELKRAE